MASPDKPPGAIADEEVIDDNASSHNSGATSEERMKVVVRVRPLQEKEEPWPQAAKGEDNGSDSASPATISIQQSAVRWEKNGQVKILKSDAVFADGATQDNVFSSIKDCVDSLIAGFDCSVFAYGQTGTGKTYTMSGLQHDEAADVNEKVQTHHGVVPRSIARLFAAIDTEKKGASDVCFSIYCSFIEIYNEKIYDILTRDVSTNTKNNRSLDAKGFLTQRARWNSSASAKESRNLSIRQKLDGSVFVDGLTSRNVSSISELLQAFREGSSNREVRDNLYNQFSSRGHSVFQITLRRTSTAQEPSKTKSKQTRLSRLFFVDLAGSEKWHLDGSKLTDKYANELASINKSLSALTNCVLALTQKERPHIPFRDSILTRLLQSCLQGFGRTAFIVTISPSKSSLEESFATLRFAERLKTVRCRPIRRSLFSSEMLGEQRLYYERQIQTMRAEVNRLRELLKRAKEKPNAPSGDPPSKNANAALVEENRRLKELLLQSQRSHLNKSGTKMSPQQLSAREMLNPTLLRSEETINSTSLRTILPDLHANNPAKRAAEGERDGITNEQPRDHLTTLETQLQSREARLNWMLEAEMESQNAGPDVANSIDSAVDSLSAETRKPVTRSWAVETRLRRQLVPVPPPMREAQLFPVGTGKQSYTVPTGSTDASSPAGYRREIKPTVPANEISPSVQSRTEPAAAQPPPRYPARRLTPAESHSRTNGAGTGSRRGRGEDKSAKPHPPGSPASKSSNPQPDQANASSILKLVGASYGDVKGKSREELIEEYKRARRVELEALMRTMVHK